jgi:hypothetical protein
MPWSQQHNKVAWRERDTIRVLRGTELLAENHHLFLTIWKILIIIITTQNGGILPFVCSADTLELGVTNFKLVQRHRKAAECFIQESWSADYTACLSSCNFSNV